MHATTFGGAMLPITAPGPVLVLGPSPLTNWLYEQFLRRKKKINKITPQLIKLQASMSHSKWLHCVWSTSNAHRQSTVPSSAWNACVHYTPPCASRRTIKPTVVGTESITGAVRPRYNVSLGTRICQRYLEINVISREFYIGAYGEGTENINVILKLLTRENVI